MMRKEYNTKSDNKIIERQKRLFSSLVFFLLLYLCACNGSSQHSQSRITRNCDVILSWRRNIAANSSILFGLSPFATITSSNNKIRCVMSLFFTELVCYTHTHTRVVCRRIVDIIASYCTHQASVHSLTHEREREIEKAHTHLNIYIY